MQGFNMGRYIPPDALDAGLTTANAAAGKPHALGARARKIGQGILTVRFEMPFVIWCTSCPKPTIIGQGVRFNAEKKRAGNYHSTPVWAFRMKHGACGGWIEIRTDPKNAEYVVFEGAKRRDYGEQGERDEDGRPVGALGVILTEEERERRRNDAFAAFEGKKEEKVKGELEGRRVEELYADRERDWSDPYAVNIRLRRGFRVERKARQKNARDTEALRDRFGLAIDVLDDTEADRRAASLIDYGDDSKAGEVGEVARRAATRPLFPEQDDLLKRSAALKDGANVKTKAAVKAALSRHALRQELKGNTRAALDPFSRKGGHGSTSRLGSIAGLKRKMTTTRNDEKSGVDPAQPLTNAVEPAALVEYDSE